MRILAIIPDKYYPDRTLEDGTIVKGDIASGLNKPTGLDYHRMIAPLVSLAKSNSDVKLSLSHKDIDKITEETVKGFDIVIFQRSVSGNNLGVLIIKQIQKLGVKVVIDIDDYWELPSYHGMKVNYEISEYPRQQVEELKQADYVTTTTEHFAYNYIQPVNKNVAVLPNALEINHEQWVSDKTSSNITRFGWIGGRYHKEDIELVAMPIMETNCDKSLRGKYQFCFGGFVNHPENMYIEKLLASNYYTQPQWYTDMLVGNTEYVDHYSLTQSYRRLHSKDVFNYGLLYDEIDVALIPLISNPFTSCKSELKVIEAGFKKCAVICQNVLPYSTLLNKENSFMVSEPYQWKKHIKYCIENKEAVKDKAEKLHEDITSKFSMKDWNKVRYDLYKKIIE